jgi:hypothetical protein
MTQQEAKELSLEVWGYLADHPDVKDKFYIPNEIYEKIRYMRGRCPFCEIFIEDDGGRCSICPLGDCESGSLYIGWVGSTTDEERKYYAQAIVDKIKAWKLKEE